MAPASPGLFLRQQKTTRKECLDAPPYALVINTYPDSEGGVSRMALFPATAPPPESSFALKNPRKWDRGIYRVGHGRAQNAKNPSGDKGPPPGHAGMVFYGWVGRR